MTRRLRLSTYDVVAILRDRLAAVERQVTMCETLLHCERSVTLGDDYIHNSYFGIDAAEHATASGRDEISCSLQRLQQTLESVLEKQRIIHTVVKLRVKELNESDFYESLQDPELTQCQLLVAQMEVLRSRAELALTDCKVEYVSSLNSAKRDVIDRLETLLQTKRNDTRNTNNLLTLQRENQKQLIEALPAPAAGPDTGGTISVDTEGSDTGISSATTTSEDSGGVIETLV